MKTELQAQNLRQEYSNCQKFFVMIKLKLIYFRRRMNMIKITLPSGDIRQFDSDSINMFDIAKSISNSLAKKSYCCKGRRQTC